MFITRILAATVTLLLGTVPATASEPAALAVTASATFLEPNSHAYVGTLVENCSGNHARVALFLARPYTLAKTAAFGVALTGEQALVVQVNAGQNDDVTFSELGGPSPYGCLPAGSGVAVVVEPMPGLEVVLGLATIVAAPK